jgi:hypothetical protein
VAKELLMAAAPTTPPDRCPYPRPFPPDFDACPAYRRTDFSALDTGYDPLQSVATCIHLEVRAGPAGGSFYGCCRLGDKAARRRWAQRMGPGPVPIHTASG